MIYFFWFLTCLFFGENFLKIFGFLHIFHLLQLLQNLKANFCGDSPNFVGPPHRILWGHHHVHCLPTMKHTKLKTWASFKKRRYFSSPPFPPIGSAVLDFSAVDTRDVYLLYFKLSETRVGYVATIGYRQVTRAAIRSFLRESSRL